MAARGVKLGSVMLIQFVAELSNETGPFKFHPGAMFCDGKKFRHLGSGTEMAIKDRIIERLAQGETLEAICRDSDMPTMETVIGWAETNGQFSSDCACAVYKYVEPDGNFRDCRVALLTGYGKPL